MSRKTYDPRLVWPYSLLLCGPTGCGKTTWIVELLRYHEHLSMHTPKKLIWIFRVEQPELFETIREIWSPQQCEFIEGFPEDLLIRLEQTSDHGSLCVFDDVMNEMSSNSMVSKLSTHGRSHLGCALVVLLQNIFPKGTQSRMISINAQYQVRFRNPRDNLQITILARQLCPSSSKEFLEIYKKATSHPYGYLFCCFTRSVIEQTFYLMNIHRLFFNFDVYCYSNDIRLKCFG